MAFPGLHHPRFEQVRNLAAGLAEGVRPLVERRLPVIVVLEENIGNVLGHSLAALLPPGHPVICVDQIRSQTGDYLDIGAPHVWGHRRPRGREEPGVPQLNHCAEEGKG